MESEIIIHELQFKAVRSSGAGGQHVNKVSSKVELSFNIKASNGLSLEEKVLIQTKLANKISKEKVLTLSCSESRSQHKNKEIVIKRFFELIKKSLKKPKVRKATKPTKSSIQKRLDKKKKLAFKKAFRRKPDL
ncbi:alternative ribosome rescue aminoacyl-tRNA hydrolase ArfB [uncultured Lutibacter sp.]|uniref:alternative ribosome rescue aminoacyl-tRNA hydrolase ArfB n=1 Tax=uncultured Lutibacter sp. TaxID=437739 RepID=UPI00262418EA|nr:alternative ribosome rescue aminoacyl-tRNA hydrolase ArfB [uncultured Lutibacter sp.]